MLCKIYWKPLSIDVRVFFLVGYSCIHVSCLKKKLLFSSTVTKWIELFVLFLASSDLRNSLIPFCTCPAYLLLISPWGALGFWLFFYFFRLLSDLTLAIISAQISVPPWYLLVMCYRLAHREIFFLRSTVQSGKYISPYKTSRKTDILVVSYWIVFFQIIHPWSCRCFFASRWTSYHLAPCEILTSMHDVPPLGSDDPPLKYSLIFIILLGMYVPVVVVHNYMLLLKQDILIVLSTCGGISTSSESFCWRVLIAFFNDGVFTGIDTYVACAFSLFLSDGVTILSNTIYGSAPGLVPGSNAFLLSTLPFFVSPVSIIPPNLRFFSNMGRFTCAAFDTLILLPLFFLYL